MRPVYCNPIDLNYGYVPFPDMKERAHRATADPLIVLFRDTYFLFSTNQGGYWWSESLVDWKFIERSFLTENNHTLDDLCAPSAFVMDDWLYVIGSTYTDQFVLWRSQDPVGNVWEPAANPFAYGGWDPGHLVDDDGRLYLYHGSSNVEPIYGIEIDPVSFEPIGEKKALIALDPEQHGWERFGEAHDNVFLKPFIEGAWMNKINGKYYLQYGGPGTEFSGYSDGVFVGEHPLGPFTYQAHNPFCSKPGGYARGSGHGGSFQARDGRWWHISTIAIGVKNNFERRNGLWPTFVDEEGTLWSDSSYSDYPMYADTGERTGWMILNAFKPVRVSSSLGAFSANFAVDESIRTYWSAATGDPGEWIESSFGGTSTLHAVQINYADESAEIAGRRPGMRHRYQLFALLDGVETLIVDASESEEDAPHKLLTFDPPVIADGIKLVNLEVPTGKFALSGLRAFGTQEKAKPQAVRDLVVLRGDHERRNAWVKWRADSSATGYVLYRGLSPDKLYFSVMVHQATEWVDRMIDRAPGYWYAIEAFHEGGIGPRTEPIFVP